RMVFADHVADDAGRLLVGAVPVVIELVHRVQHAPMDGLEAVPRIRQCAAHDDAHRVIEVASPHFLFETDGQGFFGELGHEGEEERRAKPLILTFRGLSRSSNTSLESGFVLRGFTPYAVDCVKTCGTIISRFW